MSHPHRFIRIGTIDLDQGDDAEVILTPEIARQLRSQAQTGSLGGEAQTGLVMTHRIDATTNTQLNALVDKVAGLLSRRTMIALLAVAVIAFAIGWYVQKLRAGKKRRKG